MKLNFLSKPARLIFFGILGISITVISMTWFLFEKAMSSWRAPQDQFACQPHYYDKPDVSIKNIHLQFFYFIPKDRVATWLPKAEDALTKLKPELDSLVAFHQKEFNGHSDLSYSICPIPITGKFDSSVYENDQELHNLSENVRAELVKKNGSVYYINKILPEIETSISKCGSDFVATSTSAYLINGILYTIPEPYPTGGAVILGESDEKINGLLIPSWLEYTKTKYNSWIAATIYHEIALLYGVPEGYDLKTLKDITADIMSPAHFGPIQNMYLDKTWKYHLGLSPACLK